MSTEQRAPDARNERLEYRRALANRKHAQGLCVSTDCRRAPKPGYRCCVVCIERATRQRLERLRRAA